MTGSGFNGGADAARQAWDKGLVGPGAPLPEPPPRRPDGQGFTVADLKAIVGSLSAHDCATLDTVLMLRNGEIIHMLHRRAVAGDLWLGGGQCVVGPCPFCDGGRA